ncbi:MAG TPA: prepilin-type N-terminal cleavage/methylation domain-containing protein [Sedimentisphaerales bacterium]|nr:prepilin-type N-terminal cleavage/methylation domain-containing protein [Sedimentisphaerales bacterium]
MKIIKNKRTKGMSLIEVMLAVLILAISVVGASAYRYYSTLDARRADMQSAAARIGMLLCENWRGVRGSESWDPAAHLGSELTMSPITSPPQSLGFSDFTTLGAYTVTVDGINYYTGLCWKDVSTDLRALNVVVAWSQRDTGGTINDADKLFKLTTYVTN